MKYAIFLYLIFGSSILNAATQFDIQGSTDHPLLSRYPGFFIKGYSQKEYDQATIVTGLYSIEEKKAPIKTFEGKVTNILYGSSSSKPKESILQLHRNYEQALSKLKAKMLYMCRGNDCLSSRKPLSDFSMADFGGWLRSSRDILKGIGGDRVLNGPDSSLLVASIKQKNSLIHVMITISVSQNSSLVAMSFIETANLQLDKVRISSTKEITASIEKSGKVILDGIFFDHDKSSIKSESKITLEAIAKYLKSISKERFFVVGHTDNTGAYAYNIQLSQDRANAVVNTLVNQYKVNAKQLSAVGIGPVSPAMSNQNESGQAENRRVELVKASP